MVEIKLHLPIGTEQENKWFASWGEENVVFSLETLQRIFAENTTESDFRFNIHCDGGSVYEGLAIYDALRTSGKNIYMNIEGSCHSMAITLLLAAPKENRTANANARALIHEVQIPIYDPIVSTTELEELAKEAKKEQDAILDIYADRTGTDREVLAQLMSEEKVRTASELLEYGFISKINIYNTNKNTKIMKKKQTIVNQLTKVVNMISKALGEPMNFDFTDESGNIILSTEREDETIEVGDAVVLPNGETSGEVALTDGRIIVVADGVVTEIKEAQTEEPTNEETEETTEEEVDEEKEALKKEIEDLKKQLEEARALLKEAKNHIASNYQPEARKTSPKNEQRMSAEEITAQAKSRVRK